MATALGLVDLAARALANRGIVKTNAFDLDGAIADFERSIELARSVSSPEEARARHNLGSATWFRGELVPATAHFAEAVRVGERFGVLQTAPREPVRALRNPVPDRCVAGGACPRERAHRGAPGPRRELLRVPPANGSRSHRARSRRRRACPRGREARGRGRARGGRSPGPRARPLATRLRDRRARPARRGEGGGTRARFVGGRPVADEHPSRDRHRVGRRATRLRRASAATDVHGAGELRVARSRSSRSSTRTTSAQRVSSRGSVTWTRGTPSCARASEPSPRVGRDGGERRPPRGDRLLQTAWCDELRPAGRGAARGRGPRDSRVAPARARSTRRGP